ncbi:MAG: metallophosphoesterase family protein, partial [Acidobacteriales bacterium]|nr:metallophosphoesterase family protein [Terriglobales bacterium]
LSSLPEQLTLTFAGKRLHLVHNIADLSLPSDPPHAVLYGHSHQPRIEHRNGVLYFNPGSAGPRRFRLPITCGILTISPDSITPELVTLL